MATDFKEGTGSGKTSGSGQTIARSFLRAGMGGLVLCTKPSEIETDGQSAGTPEAIPVDRLRRVTKNGNRF